MGVRVPRAGVKTARDKRDDFAEPEHWLSDEEMDGHRVGDLVKHVRHNGTFKIIRFCRKNTGAPYADLYGGVKGGEQFRSFLLPDLVATRRPKVKPADVGDTSAGGEESDGKWVRATRELLGLKRPDVAEKAGMTMGRLCAIETKKEPTPDEYAALLAVFKEAGYVG